MCLKRKWLWHRDWKKDNEKSVHSVDVTVLMKWKALTRSLSLLVILQRDALFLGGIRQNIPERDHKTKSCFQTYISAKYIHEKPPRRKWHRRVWNFFLWLLFRKRTVKVYVDIGHTDQRQQNLIVYVHLSCKIQRDLKKKFIAQADFTEVGHPVNVLSNRAISWSRGQPVIHYILRVAYIHYIPI